MGVMTYFIEKDKFKVFSIPFCPLKQGSIFAATILELNGLSNDDKCLKVLNEKLEADYEKNIRNWSQQNQGAGI